MTNGDSLTYWLERISTSHNQRIDMGLERVSQVAMVMQVDCFDIPVIHVAGTNGKGTCVHALAAIYRQAGYRVGAYTSPHLLQINERICVDGINVSDAELDSALAQVDSLSGLISLTYFEYLTLAALLIFKQANLDVVILEVGLGGRLDATNLVQTTLGIITSIALDHQDRLGETCAQIAVEKGGIIKAGMQAMVLGDITVLDVIETKCRQQLVPCYSLGRDFDLVCCDERWVWRGREVWPLPESSLVMSNLACVYQAVMVLQSRLPVRAGQAYAGLALMKVPGRFECHALPQKVVLDVAHNPASSHHLAAKIMAMSASLSTVVVVAMLPTKSVKESLLPWLDIADIWRLPDLDEVEMVSSQQMLQILVDLGVHRDRIFANITMLDVARKINNHNQKCTRTIIFGSFHTVAAFKRAVMADAEDGD